MGHSGAHPGYFNLVVYNADDDVIVIAWIPAGQNYAYRIRGRDVLRRRIVTQDFAGMTEQLDSVRDSQPVKGKPLLGTAK